MGSGNPFRSPITAAACLLGAMAAPLLSENAFCFAAATEGAEYGTQCSFSITGPVLDGCDPSLIEQGQAFYDGYMEGCYKNANKKACKKAERDRHSMNVRQPQSMINMTKTGYQKTKAPAHIVDLLTKFWETNKHKKVLEEWDPESIYVNHWEAPSYILDVGNAEYEGGGESLKEDIWNTAVDAIAEWTGGLAKLRPVSLYGIREYTNGAVLSPHVDRVPLVSSGIVNIAQDVDEPWPLEVYGRDGLAVNITMEPGDMIFYESHSLIHGRPFPLRGRYFANVFIHFEPFDGWDKARGETELLDSSGDLPPYILPGSPEEESFRSENPDGWSKYFVQGEEPPCNTYAAEGDLEKLKELGENDPKFLFYEDENGWTPLFEAVAGGHMKVVEYLVDAGVGGLKRALDIATDTLGPRDAITKYLGQVRAKRKHHKLHGRSVDSHDGVPSIVEYVKEKTPEIVPVIINVADDDEEL